MNTEKGENPKNETSTLSILWVFKDFCTAQKVLISQQS